MAAGDHVVADVGWVRVGERMGRGRRGSRWIFLDRSSACWVVWDGLAFLDCRWCIQEQGSTEGYLLSR